MFPGPCGAGAYIRKPGGELIYLYEALGNGTNNHGELWAAGMLFSFLDEEKVPTYDLIYVVIDSQVTMNGLVGLSVSKARRQEFHKVRRLLRKREKHVRFLLAPSHTEIKGNDIADELADEGSAASAKGAKGPRVHPHLQLPVLKDT